MKSAEEAQASAYQTRTGLIIGAFFTLGLTAAIGVPIVDSQINQIDDAISGIRSNLCSIQNSQTSAQNDRTRAKRAKMKNESDKSKLETHLILLLTFGRICWCVSVHNSFVRAPWASQATNGQPKQL